MTAEKHTIAPPRTAYPARNSALATYEDILVDALLAQHGGRNRLRLLGDEELHRARLAIWRDQVTAAEWFADIPDPVLVVSRVLALGQARAAVEAEEERREHARRFADVPRDPAHGWVSEAIIEAIKDRLTPETLVRQWGLTELRSLARGKAVGKCPFHPDDSPSFYTYAGDNPGWKCFGCQRYGDVFDLAREHTGLGFRDVCEGLAGGAGVPWPVEAPQPARPDQRRYLHLARGDGEDA